MYQRIKSFFVPKLVSSWISSTATGILGSGIPIFMLHRIYPDNTPNRNLTPSYLRRCLKYLKANGYHFISVTDIIKSIKNNEPLPNKAVAFTIDDGFLDQATLGATVFIEFECPVTIFLVTDFLDGKLWPWFSQVQYMVQSCELRSIDFSLGEKKTTYNLNNNKEKRNTYRAILDSIKDREWSELDKTLKQLSGITNITIPEKPPEQFQPMSWAMAQALEKEGILFGPHSVTHPILSKVSDEQASNEIHNSWQRLQQELQNPSPVFCYPNGDRTDYGKREIEILKNTNLIGAVSTIHQQFRMEKKIADIAYNIPRYSLPENYDDFLMYCSWIELAKEKIRKN